MGEVKLNIKSDFTEYDQWSDLPEKVQQLLEAAKKVSTSAYAPYSKFKVGAAVLLENNVIVTGCNQENAAYPSGLCAERVALFSAHSSYPKQAVLSIAIYATNNEATLVDPVTPCGGYRQVISEYEDLAGKQIDVYMASESRVIKASGIESLLPLRFRLSR